MHELEITLIVVGTLLLFVILVYFIYLALRANNRSIKEAELQAGLQAALTRSPSAISSEQSVVVKSVAKWSSAWRSLEKDLRL